MIDILSAIYLLELSDFISVYVFLGAFVAPATAITGFEVHALPLIGFGCILTHDLDIDEVGDLLGQHVHVVRHDYTRHHVYHIVSSDEHHEGPFIDHDE